MTNIFSLEFLVAVLFIVDVFLFLLIILIVKRVSRFRVQGTDPSSLQADGSGRESQEAAFESAAQVLELLEPLVKESKAAANDFESLLKEKKKLTKDLNDALDSRIISINLLLSRAATLQKQMEEEQQRLRHSMTSAAKPPPSLSPREPDVIDQQNQILDLHRSRMDVDTIAEQLSIPKGEVQLVIDLKEKFMAMEQGR